MRKSRLPALKYIVPALPIFVRVFESAVMELGSTFDWWQEMPWDGIVLGSVAFLLGALYADILNPTSKLRMWLRYKYRYFDVDSINCRRRVTSNSEEDVVTVDIHFVRSFRGKLIVQLFECVHDGRSRMKSKSWVVEDDGDYKKGESKSITLASIPNIKTSYPIPVWGGRGDSPVGQIIDESQNIIVLKAAGRMTQNHDTVLKMLKSDTNDRIRFFITHEDEDLYEVKGD
ncbi:hypothetical protein [Minwuia thermotolerans]|uniref:hypothetical protein n=1 Tax=Minwuia thermotolerans TaxID=2056226 RepID=UPI0013FDFBCD|nr:hypothetical protein [Minwuia thermotolerans]